jgi:hypothetical protein
VGDDATDARIAAALDPTALEERRAVLAAEVREDGETPEDPLHRPQQGDGESLPSPGTSVRPIGW